MVATVAWALWHVAEAIMARWHLPRLLLSITDQTLSQLFCVGARRHRICAIGACRLEVVGGVLMALLLPRAQSIFCR